jgi:site-specific DNA-methyltransferase (adenine-specific)
MEYLIKTYTNEGETVLDFTMGSGTTGVACVNLNRDFIGIEMDDKYFEIAKGRIEEAKGLF